MRIRSTKPEFWRSGEIDPFDRPSWKAFGTAAAGSEFLYRLYGYAHELLYVGITWNPRVRWTEHSKTKPWWREVVHAEVWRCLYEEARAWESRCIKEQAPKYNIHQAVKV